MDNILLQTPIYSADLTRAQQETHVFKFADRINVRFNCQIKLCAKTGGDCDTITVRKTGSCGGGCGGVLEGNFHILATEMC